MPLPVDDRIHGARPANARAIHRRACEHAHDDSRDAFLRWSGCRLCLAWRRLDPMSPMGASARAHPGVGVAIHGSAPGADHGLAHAPDHGVGCRRGAGPASQRHGRDRGGPDRLYERVLYPAPGRAGAFLSEPEREGNLRGA